jgi:hypothetical protein
LVIPRLAYIPLRPSQPLPRSATARTARPRDPEPLPLRFITRPGPGLLEPFRSFLTEKCLLRRAVEHRCGWKGCDAVLASEDILRSHVQVRNHAGQGKFMAGVSSDCGC